MPKGSYLGELELLVLSAIDRLDDDAYGGSIQDEIEKQTGRDASIGAIHSALVRLNAKGFVAFGASEPLPIRGGRAKKLVRLTPAGTRTLRTAGEGLARMLGLELRPR
jgi:PadR family transcriptional regulator PadR